MGITSRRIRQLADEGIIQSDGKNSYNLAQSVQAYNRYLKSGLPTEDDAKIEKIKKTADAQLKASKSQMAKLQLQELQGKMHRSEDVADMTSDLVFAIRGALIALPGRLAVNVVGVNSSAEASDIIKKEVHLIMKELSEYKYDPDKYAERVRQRMDWDTKLEDDDEE